MKRTLLSALILASGIAISCTKTAQTSQAVQHVTKGITSVIEKKFSVEGEDSVDFTITANPSVICTSYGNNQSPTSCEINIDFKCQLSRPVNSYVRIELERTNEPELKKQKDKDPDPRSDDLPDPGARVVLVMAPNTTSKTFSSNLQNINNLAVPDNEFRVVSAGVFTLMN